MPVRRVPGACGGWSNGRGRPRGRSRGASSRRYGHRFCDRTPSAAQSDAGDRPCACWAGVVNSSQVGRDGASEWPADTCRPAGRSPARRTARRRSRARRRPGRSRGAECDGASRFDPAGRGPLARMHSSHPCPPGGRIRRGSRRLYRTLHADVVPRDRPGGRTAFAAVAVRVWIRSGGAPWLLGRCCRGTRLAGSEISAAEVAAHQVVGLDPQPDQRDPNVVSHAPVERRVLSAGRARVHIPARQVARDALCDPLDGGLAHRIPSSAQKSRRSYARLQAASASSWSGPSSTAAAQVSTASWQPGQNQGSSLPASGRSSSVIGCMVTPRIPWRPRTTAATCGRPCRPSACVSGAEERRATGIPCPTRSNRAAPAAGGAPRCRSSSGLRR